MTTTNLSLAQRALVAVTLMVVSAADPCPCVVEPIPSGPGYMRALCQDLDMDHVPACVPNSTRLLGFSGNALHHVGPETLEGLPALLDLVADRSQVENLTADAFAHSPLLRHVNLQRNSIRELPAGLFDAAPQLQVVDFSNNMLRSLPGGLFRKVLGLRSLDLSHNYLSTLPGDLLGGCAPQSSLYLAGNQLTELPAPLLQTCRTLYSLDVSSNKIPQMAVDVVAAVANLTDLHSLRLEDNPWHCDCRQKLLTEVLLTHDALERHLTCASPQSLSKQHVVHVVSGMDCAPLPASVLHAETSAHAAPEHRRRSAVVVALTAVASVSIVLTIACFSVRYYLKRRSDQFNLLNNEEE